MGGPGEFQFLIGRLVTAELEKVSAELMEFQFLIGRLVTEIIKEKKSGHKEFQFLIGRLVTGSGMNYEMLPEHSFNSS